MLLTLTVTSGAGMADATALGFLLHKHPDRVQSFELAAGSATSARRRQALLGRAG